MANYKVLKLTDEYYTIEVFVSAKDMLSISLTDSDREFPDIISLDKNDVIALINELNKLFKEM